MIGCPDCAKSSAGVCGAHPLTWPLPAWRYSPHSCPVCGGRGTVSPGFYANGYSTTTYTTTCRACSGSGIVWGYSHG